MSQKEHHKEAIYNIRIKQKNYFVELKVHLRAMTNPKWHKAAADIHVLKVIFNPPE
jgi:hypothetical protein